MTDKERIAALELSNQRMRELVQSWAEAGNIHNYSQLSDKLDALSSTPEPRMLSELRAARDALKRAEMSMFHACQPDHGELFGEFDELNRPVRARLDAFLKSMGEE